MANATSAQQLDGPRNLQEAIELLAAKGQTDGMVLQSLEIIIAVINQLAQQSRNLQLNLQFNGFLVGKLAEKLGDDFDLDAFVKEALEEFNELLAASQPDDAEENAG